MSICAHLCSESSSVATEPSHGGGGQPWPEARNCGGGRRWLASSTREDTMPEDTMPMGSHHRRRGPRGTLPSSRGRARSVRTVSLDGHALHLVAADVEPLEADPGVPRRFRWSCGSRSWRCCSSNILNTRGPSHPPCRLTIMARNSAKSLPLPSRPSS